MNIVLVPGVLGFDRFVLPVSALFLPTFAIVSHKVSGKNDGVVSLKSATRRLMP